MTLAEVTELKYAVLVLIANQTPCDIWPGSLDKDGYGRTHGTLVHQRAYREAYGPVPDGLELDHICRVRACRNPQHLEAVTHTENMRRGDREAYGNYQRSKTHCPWGHPYSGDNLMSRACGRRGCRTCENTRKLARYYQNKETRSVDNRR